MNDQPQERGRLTVVPLKAVKVGRIGIPCKRPTCSSIIDSNESGRPKEFCTTSCKERYHREARKALQQLKEELGVAQAYGHQLALVETRGSEKPPVPNRRGPTEASSSAAWSRVSFVTSEEAAPADPGVSTSVVPDVTDVPRSSAGTEAHTDPYHQRLLVELLHDVGIAIAQLGREHGEESPVLGRLSRRRDDIYRQLASHGE